MRVVAWPAYTNKDVNPYNYLLYSGLVEFGVEVYELSKNMNCFLNYDIVHVHWPENLPNEDRWLISSSKISIFSSFLTIQKRRGAKIVWTVHNLQAHDRKQGSRNVWFQNWLDRWFIPRIDGVISLTHSGLELALDRYPALRSKAFEVIPHGHYINSYPNNATREEAREIIGISNDSKVVLFIGNVRPYKNVAQLIDSFIEMEDQDVNLIIAGNPTNEDLKIIINNGASNDSRIHPYLCFVEKEMMQYFLNASDLVVLPYQDILNSGSAILALSFFRPVLVPRKGSMSELQSQFGVECVKTYDGELEADTLRAALTSVIDNPVDPHILEKRVRQNLDWSIVAGRTYDFYKALLSKSQGDR